MARTKTIQFRAVTEDGFEVAAAASYGECAEALRKRLVSLVRGMGGRVRSESVGGSSIPGAGKVENTERFAIVGPDGAVRTRHSWTILL